MAMPFIDAIPLAPRQPADSMVCAHGTPQIGTPSAQAGVLKIDAPRCFC